MKKKNHFKKATVSRQFSIRENGSAERHGQDTVVSSMRAGQRYLLPLTPASTSATLSMPVLRKIKNDVSPFLCVLRVFCVLLLLLLLLFFVCVCFFLLYLGTKRRGGLALRKQHKSNNIMMKRRMMINDTFLELRVLRSPAQKDPWSGPWVCVWGGGGVRAWEGVL